MVFNWPGGSPGLLQAAEKLHEGVILSEAKNLSASKLQRKREILRAKPALRMTSTLFLQPV
jgi:hypothetical protein